MKWDRALKQTWIVLKRSSATPFSSLPSRWGWNIASGALNLSAPSLITRPSGRVYDSTLKVVSFASISSCLMSYATKHNFSLISRTVSKSAVWLKAYPRSNNNWKKQDWEEVRIKVEWTCYILISDINQQSTLCLTLIPNPGYRLQENKHSFSTNILT